jgi:uncharacterized protein (UPF0335 family)
MTRFVLTLLLIAACTTSYSQEIKLSGEAEKSYVTKEQTRAQLSRALTVAQPEAKQTEDAPPAYVALDLIKLENDATLRVYFDPGAAVRKAQYMSEDLKKVERLEEMVGQFTTDVDVLNYVSQMGWDVVSVTRSELKAPQKGENTRVYIRKILQE